MRFVSWSATDTGRKRAHNEDNFLAADDLCLYAVADGMGGHQGGARASFLALEVLAEVVRESQENLEASAARLLDLANRQWDGEYGNTPRETTEFDGTGEFAEGEEFHTEFDRHLPAAQIVALGARKASHAVFSEGLNDESLEGMGTTLTAVYFDSERIHLAHAGDSRAYLYRNGTIRQLTDDHSWTAEQVRSGRMTAEEAEASEYRHVITRSIGYQGDVLVDMQTLVAQAGDCLLLCSDGLSNLVSEEEILEHMERLWFSQLPDALIALANERGGDDNITVVVVYAANHLPDENHS